MAKRITIVDIAKASGYSISAVSKALSDAPDISKKAKNKIKKKCDELGYVQNITASSLKSGNSKIIAVLYDSFLNPYYNEMVYYIENLLKKLNYTIIIYRSNEFDILTFNNIISRNAEGLISFLAPNDIVAEKIKEVSFPTVIVGRSYKGIASIYSDNENIGRLAAEYMIKKGKKNAVYLGEIYDLSIVRERYDGFKKLLDENGIKSTPFFKDNYVANKEFLNSLDENEIVNADCIFCFNDIMAFDAMIYLKKRNKEGTLIVGVDCIHDEIPLPFPFVSIGGNKEKTSITIVDKLLSQIKANKLDDSHIITESQIKNSNI